MWARDDKPMASRIPYKQRRHRTYPKFRSDHTHNMTVDPVLVVDIQRGVVVDDLARLLERPKPWYGGKGLRKHG